LNYVGGTLKPQGVFMKNTIKIIGIIAMVAVIGFSMAACADDSSGDEGFATDGRLTITGLNDYNGQFVSATFVTDDGLFVAAKDASIKSLGGDKWLGYHHAKISGGTVTLNVYEFENKDVSLKNFTINGEITFDVEIAPTEDDYSDIVGTVTVTFTNGKGTGAFEAD
jgi:hypothetical protein